jgi:hypothetical protein
MDTHRASYFDASGHSLPLTIPEELWNTLPDDQRTVYQDAQRVLDTLSASHTVTLRDITHESGIGVEAALYALRALDSMSLINVSTDGRSVIVRLLAVPDEHVALTGPDGTRRWLFVARPLDPPVIDPANLN